MTALLTVVGIGADGWVGLNAAAQQAITESEVLIGSPRQLSLVPDVAPLRVPWPSPLLPALRGLLDEYADRRTAVLASGDPMFHGIGVTLSRLVGPQRIRVLPQPSSASLACARLGWSAAETPTVSLVNRPVETVLPALANNGKLLVLSQNEDSPAAIAKLLADNGYGGSHLVVLEQLGGPLERTFDGIAAEWEHAPGNPLNVVAISCVAEPGLRRRTRTPGLPDDVFGGDGQRTKQEVRALTLSALAPAPGELLWDVGGGSGSIAIEWSRMHPRCRAIAFERLPARAAQITVNAAALGVPSVAVRGEAPDAFAEAAEPNAIFIGGGLTEPGLLAACWDRLGPGGRLVANAVTAESEAVVTHWAAEHGGQLRRFQIYRAEPLGNFTAWRPQLPVTQLIAERE